MKFLVGIKKIRWFKEIFKESRWFLRIQDREKRQRERGILMKFFEVERAFVIAKHIVLCFFYK